MGAEQWEMGSYGLMVTVSVWSDENILEIGSGDFCTSLGCDECP